MDHPVVILYCPDCGKTQTSPEAFAAITCPDCGSDVPPFVYSLTYPSL